MPYGHQSRVLDGTRVTGSEAGPRTGTPTVERGLRGVVLALTAGTVLVVLLDVAAKTSARLDGARRWVDVGLENNVPTSWSVLLLLVLAGRLWRCRGLHWMWRAATLAAVTLAVDEWVGWHEHLRVPGEVLRDAGISLPTYAWVLPGVTVAAAAVAAAMPWLRSLPDEVARRVVLSVLVFCSGALGVEAVSGLVHHRGAGVEVWGAVTSLEEALEMGGVLLALSAFGRQPGTAPRPVEGSSGSPAV